MDLVFRKALDATDGCPQSQASLHDQMIEGIALANKFGLCDLADYLQQRIKESDKESEHRFQAARIQMRHYLELK